MALDLHSRGMLNRRCCFHLFLLLPFIVGSTATSIRPMSADSKSSPEQAHWLSEEERSYVVARLQADQGRNAAERNVGFRDVLTVMKDYRVWLGGFMYFGLIVPVSQPHGYSSSADQH